MYSCIQEILGGLSKCLPTRLLITTEKSPDTDINFYTLARRQIHTHTHTHTQIICSSLLIYKWMTGGRSAPICVLPSWTLNYTVCSFPNAHGIEQHAQRRRIHVKNSTRSYLCKYCHIHDLTGVFPCLVCWSVTALISQSRLMLRCCAGTCRIYCNN